MHDSGRTESLHDAATQTAAIRHPATLPLPQTGIALLFWCWGANSHCAGRARMHDGGRTKSLHDAATQTTAKARMPYKMNAQSFKQGCLKSAALSCHTMWQLSAADEARCETNKAFINVQRMHDGGRTKSLHDAATQMTAIRHPATLPLPQTGIALLFLVLGGELALCG